jgi:HSP20 family molecular chaperone IbpA
MSDQEKSLEVQKQEAITADDVERTRDRPCYVPRADIYETADEIVVVADIPGADEKSVDITLEKDVLTINADIEEDEPEGYALAFAEYQTGDYQRSFTISASIARDQIEATIKHGVLHLHLPKVDVARTKTISVKAG